MPNGTSPNPVKLLPNRTLPHQLQRRNRRWVELGHTGSGPQRSRDLANDGRRPQCGADDRNLRWMQHCSPLGTHHDFVFLPNGYLIVLAATQRDISGTTVTGDAIIDLDENHQPVWLWNEFDHLDVNRQPMAFPDWTHTNAIIYSADDGNLIISIRHQNWLVKVDYANGAEPETSCGNWAIRATSHWSEGPIPRTGSTPSTALHLSPRTPPVSSHSCSLTMATIVFFPLE